MSLAFTALVSNGRQLPPKTETVTRFAKILINRLNMDTTLTVSQGVSSKGFHFVRFQGTTRGTPWKVDLFRCRFYVVSCGNRRNTTWNNLAAVLAFLQASV